MLLLVLGTVAHGDPITILWDDFEGYQPSDTTWIPPVGQPWKLFPAVEGDLKIVSNELGDSAFFFGQHQNRAVTPFSALDRQLIATEQNTTISFDYFGFQTKGSSHHFDIAAYDPVSGDPAFFVRFSPESTAPGELTHNVLYRDPSEGLIDTGLDVFSDKLQTITLTADFADANYVLDIDGLEATLPMFICPDEIAGIEFANYGVAMGSGTIDNLRVTVDGMPVPEMATAVMLAMGGLLFVCVRLCRRRSAD